MQRRQFLISPVLITALGSHSTSAKELNNQTPVYISASKTRIGNSKLIWLNQSGERLKEVSLESRGHSFTQSANGHLAAIARRPAQFCLIFDPMGKQLNEFYAPKNRHFYGHGIYDLSGQYLYLTENDYDNGRGVIGVYDVYKNYQRIAEFSSYGIGPHDIRLNNDGSQLIIANGGIRTHPGTGRKKLNLTSMQPSLVFIDRETGVLKNKTQLNDEDRMNSIRHLTVSKQNYVYIALQHQTTDQVYKETNKQTEQALIAAYNPATNTLKKLVTDTEVEQKLQAYVGDIALDSSQQFLAASSPYGNTLLLCDTDGSNTHTFEISDVSGISASSKAGQFNVSSGSGQLYQIQVKADNEAPKLRKTGLTNTAFFFDNHLTRINHF